MAGITIEWPDSFRPQVIKAAPSQQAGGPNFTFVFFSYHRFSARLFTGILINISIRETYLTNIFQRHGLLQSHV